MLVAAPLALLAGLFFSLAGVLQQSAAARQPGSRSLSPALVLSLAQDGRWLLGISAAVLSYVFQALALAFGPLAAVQPLIVTEIVFALPLSARLAGQRLAGRDWAGLVLVVTGLATALAVLSPDSGETQPSLDDWLPALLSVVVVAALVTAAARRRRQGPARASLLALAAGVVMGAQSGLLAATTQRFSRGALVGFTSWQPYAMTLASLVGLVLIQSAYQAGPLAASMPVIDATEPATAVVLGVGLFHEQLSTAAPALLVGGTAVAVVLAGIALLDTSPLTDRLQPSPAEPAGPTADLPRECVPAG